MCYRSYLTSVCISQAAGGFVDSEGYVNGALGVARVLGDFHLEMKNDDPDAQPGPLTGRRSFPPPRLNSNQVT